jgi:hypothetical protein
MRKDNLLFDEYSITENKVEDHYIGMPEYSNINEDGPFIIATFKFRNQKDYDYFHSVVKKELYSGEKVFDGMQSKEKKQAWFPLKEKASMYYYGDRE